MDDYKGVLWDIEESPYFKGGKMDKAVRADAVTSIDEIYHLKFELEEKLIYLFMEFEARTNMTIQCVHPIADEDGLIEDVELEVVL